MNEIFDISLIQPIVDSNGLYRGHTFLSGIMEAHVNHFGKVLKENLPPNELKTIKEIFFQGLFREYYEAQQSLAQKYLERKRVNVTCGIPKANAEPEDFSVYWIDRPDWFTLTKEKSVLIELAYGSDTIGRILVTKNTEIQILGDIPED